MPATWIRESANRRPQSEMNIRRLRSLESFRPKMTSRTRVTAPKGRLTRKRLLTTRSSGSSFTNAQSTCQCALRASGSRFLLIGQGRELGDEAERFQPAGVQHDAAGVNLQSGAGQPNLEIGHQHFQLDGGAERLAE